MGPSLFRCDLVGQMVMLVFLFCPLTPIFTKLPHVFLNGKDIGSEKRVSPEMSFSLETMSWLTPETAVFATKTTRYSSQAMPPSVSIPLPQHTIVLGSGKRISLLPPLPLNRNVYFGKQRLFLGRPYLALDFLF